MNRQSIVGMDLVGGSAVYILYLSFNVSGVKRMYKNKACPENHVIAIKIPPLIIGIATKVFMYFQMSDL